MECPTCGNHHFERLDIAIVRCTECYSLFDPYVYSGFPEPKGEVGQVWDTSSSSITNFMDEPDTLDYDDNEDTDDYDEWDDEDEEEEDDNDYDEWNTEPGSANKPYSNIKHIVKFDSILWLGTDDGLIAYDPDIDLFINRDNRLSNTRNKGTPSRAVITPTGSWRGASTVLASVSDNTRNDPPNRVAAGISMR